MSWTQFFIGILPLLGVAVGGYATYITQTRILSKQLDRDKEKEKEEKNIDRLSVYSQILKLDGERVMQQYSGDLGYHEFNLSSFMTEFRPIFYSRFYLLDRDIADLIRKIDDIIIEENIIGVYEEFGNNSLLSLYDQIIMGILTHLDEYRKNNF